MPDYIRIIAVCICGFLIGNYAIPFLRKKIGKKTDADYKGLTKKSAIVLAVGCIVFLLLLFLPFYFGKEPYEQRARDLYRHTLTFCAAVLVPSLALVVIGILSVLRARQYDIAELYENGKVALIFGCALSAFAVSLFLIVRTLV